VQKDNRTVAGEVITQLKAMICGGELAPGDRLPPERELAEQLGVSRSSLREGIRTLTLLGVVETRHGSGTAVAQDATTVLHAPFEFLIGLEQPDLVDLYDARRVIECAIAERAALRHTDDQVAQLWNTVDEMAGAAESPARFIDPNVAFHRALAQMSGNVVLTRVMESLMVSIRLAIATTNAVGRDPSVTVAVHRAIAEAVARQDPDAAVAAMHEHMDLALSELETLETTTQ